MGYTKAQLSAIDAPVKDIIVSAGAGSGKTTVLTNRIIKQIEEKRADIRSFLVATFTKASAADLRRKLGEKLEKLTNDHPEDRHYRKQLYALPAASIGTIDSFCLQHVKQNATELGLTKGVSVGDDALCKALVTSCIDNLITELCEDDSEDISLLLDNFASYKNDDGFIAAVNKLYESLRRYPFYLSWLDIVLETHAADMETLKTKGFYATRYGDYVKSQVTAQVSKLRILLEGVELAQETDKDIKFYKAVAEQFSKIETASTGTYEEYCQAVLEYKVPACRSTSPALAEAYKYYKAAADKRKELVRSPEELEKEFELTAQVLAALVRFVKRLDVDYASVKAERGIIDFPDAGHFFLKLLMDEEGNKTPLCIELSNLYTQVYVDEYQDVSPLQDSLFAAIGTGKRFMVGDVKQSIYGFRDAYPDIFMGYRDSFLPVEENGATARVLLKENFRCDKNIIAFCNYLFEQVFTVEKADTDYKAEKLVFKKSETEELPVTLTLMENSDIERESAYVAEEIGKLLASGVKAKDIAVITRKTRSVMPFILALEARGIPCTTEKTADMLFKQPEVLLMLSLLRTIDNPTDDISLAALLRSPIFRFTADELLVIRRSGGGNSYYDNLQSAAAAETPLGKKCAAFMERLAIYRTKSLILPADALIWYLYQDTNILVYAPEGREARYKDNLFALYELARGLESDSYKGLPVLVDYMSRLIQDDRSPKAATANEENAVSVMLMHGAKGLEFSYVFVTDTNTTIPDRSKKESLYINYNTGISLRLANQKEAWSTSTLLRDFSLSLQYKRTVAEEYRLLYVAFTRAKRKLYISCSLPATVEEYMQSQPEKPSRLSQLFMPTLLSGSDASYVTVTVNGETDIPLTPYAEGAADADKAAIQLPSLTEDTPEASRITAKYSVSQLQLSEDGVFTLAPERLVTDRLPVFAGGRSANIGAAIGTATHAFLQFADYARAEEDVVAEAERLIKRGFIRKEDSVLLNIPALQRFFHSGIYLQIKESDAVYREKRFTTTMPAYLFGAEGEDVLVQGVIDCFFRNADGTYTLVDYKTDYLRRGQEELLAERYSAQLQLYSLYIEKVTGAKVSGAYIYSLALDKVIPCDIK